MYLVGIKNKPGYFWRDFMKACILTGSPRKNGNTAALLQPVVEELRKNSFECETIILHDKRIEPCTACRVCQDKWTEFGCVIQDDMYPISDKILKSDLIILTTPIYSWYATAPMKGALDRLVYGMNKYFGEKKGPAIWSGKKLALVVTCGYRAEQGADLFEEGIKRYCKHSQLSYLGMLVERDKGYKVEFMNEDIKLRAMEFTKEIINSVNTI